MSPLKLDEVFSYIKDNIGPEFHDKKIAKLNKLTLNDVIRRKNPYLFRAKSTNSAHDFIAAVLDATVSSGEETVFGNFLEKIAIFVCGRVYGGGKSSTIALDLDFNIGEIRYLVSIKSGPSWGNSSQIEALIKKFNTAKKTLATSGGAKGMHIVCVEACCYGVDSVPDKGTHLKLCGQRFWELISDGNETLYRDIIEPLAHQAKEKNDALDLLYTAKLNLFTQAFVERFCNDGIIDWDRLIQFNSGKERLIETQIAPIPIIGEIEMKANVFEDMNLKPVFDRKKRPLK